MQSCVAIQQAGKRAGGQAPADACGATCSAGRHAAVLPPCLACRGASSHHRCRVSGIAAAAAAAIPGPAAQGTTPLWQQQQQVRWASMPCSSSSSSSRGGRLLQSAAAERAGAWQQCMSRVSIAMPLFPAHPPCVQPARMAPLGMRADEAPAAAGAAPTGHPRPTWGTWVITVPCLMRPAPTM